MTTFPTPTPVSLELELAVGAAQLDASDRADTVVDVRPSDPGRPADVDAAEQTVVDFAGGRLTVRTPNRRYLGPSRKSGSVDVRIQLPTGSQVRGQGSLAAFRTTGVLGECRLKTSMGDLDLEQATSVELRTGFGRVAVDGVAGDADVTTGTGEIRVGTIAGAAVVKNHNGATFLGDVGGDLRVKAANGSVSVGHAGGDVVASSACGDVRVDGLTRGSASLKTGMGEIEVGIATGTAARLDAHTSFGRVRSLLDRVGGPQDAVETVEVEARTAMGDIVIRRADPVPA